MKHTIANILKIAMLVAVMIAASTEATAQLIVRKDSVAIARRAELEKEKVIVGEDTVSVILPERNFGRYDRGLYNYLFIPKGKWAIGLTASYGELTTEDSQLLSILTDLDFSGKIYSINPTISYFIRHNQSIGIKLTYSRGVADLASFSVDFDDDLNFSIHDVSYYTESYAMGTFYRNYVGLGSQRRFGVFNEVSLMFQTGSSRFKRLFNDEPRDTRTTITQGSLNFSPGLAVFLQQNAAFNVSFGVFGLKLRHEAQTTNGADEGSRTTSGANFKFNIFNINFGLLVVI
jgi:hypothetical protein